LLLFIGTAFTSLAAGKWRSTDELEKQSKTYHGSCHCGKVQFKVVGPRHLVAWDCNCSICHMKKNWHFIVPYADFELLSGSDVLTEYKFNTMVAKHVFCLYAWNSLVKLIMYVYIFCLLFSEQRCA
jgi:hypothetical protein